MTWLRFTDTFAERPVWEELGTDALALHVAALGYSNRHLVDGRLTRSQVCRLLWLDDALEIAGRLVEAGVWDEDDDGAFVIVADLADQLPSDEVERQRTMQAERAKRNRMHKRGDHRECNPVYCKAAGHDGSRDASRDESRGSHVTKSVTRSGTPTRPDPTRPEGSRGGEDGDGAHAAPAAAQKCRHGVVIGADGYSCDQCPPVLRAVPEGEAS